MQAQAQIQALEVAARSSNAPATQAEQSRKEKEAIQKDLQETRKAWDAERRQLNGQIERLERQLQRVSESREKVSDDIVDQLRQQYEQRLQDVISQKTQLAEQLQSASSLLEAERGRLSAAQSEEGPGPDSDAIAAEVTRVEGLISEIIGIIDNPDTELSTIIRKNVEKSELDSYLKGILFALGRSQK